MLVRSGTIKYSLKSNADWIQLSSKEGSVSSNTNKVIVTIDRSVISTGSYRKNIILTHEKGEVNVEVKVEQVEKSAPKVSIGDFDNVTENSFLIKGVITGTGGLKITNHGHCWSESENPNISSTKSNLGDTQEVGEFTSQVTGLTSGKTYYVRAYATNSKGTTYSEQVTITIDRKSVV